MAFDFTNKVDPKASRAIYLQLLDMIQGQIQDKSLKPGDMLPSEKEFCQHYHISRTTVRLTFRELEQQGLIIRRRGLGTFISEPKVSRRLGSLYSFTEDMKKLGLTPSSQILSYRLISRECGSCALREFQSGTDPPKDKSFRGAWGGHWPSAAEQPRSAVPTEIL